MLSVSVRVDGVLIGLSGMGKGTVRGEEEEG